MAYTTPSTRATGYTVTAANWNELVNDIIALRPGVCIARRDSTAQSIPDTTSTAIVFDTEDVDTESFIDVGGANPTRITFPRDGIYLISADVTFAANSTGARKVALVRSAAEEAYLVKAAESSGVTSCRVDNITGPRTAGMYFEVYVSQTSTGALDATARVAVTLLYDQT